MLFAVGLGKLREVLSSRLSTEPLQNLSPLFCFLEPPMIHVSRYRWDSLVTSATGSELYAFESCANPPQPRDSSASCPVSTRLSLRHRSVPLFPSTVASYLIFLQRRSLNFKLFFSSSPPFLFFSLLRFRSPSHRFSPPSSINGSFYRVSPAALRFFFFPPLQDFNAFFFSSTPSRRFCPVHRICHFVFRPPCGSLLFPKIRDQSLLGMRLKSTLLFVSPLSICTISISFPSLSSLFNSGISPLRRPFKSWPSLRASTNPLFYRAPLSKIFLVKSFSPSFPPIPQLSRNLHFFCFLAAFFLGGYCQYRRLINRPFLFSRPSDVPLLCLMPRSGDSHPFLSRILFPIVSQCGQYVEGTSPPSPFEIPLQLDFKMYFLLLTVG